MATQFHRSESPAVPGTFIAMPGHSEIAQSYESKLEVSFRGHKVEIPLLEGTTVLDVKSGVVRREVARHDEEHVSSTMAPSDVKLLFQGKQLSDDTLDLSSWPGLLKKKKKVYHMIATGVSSQEANIMQQEFQEGLSKAPRIRDDITENGKRELAERRRLGRVMLHQAARRNTAGCGKSYGFGKIETLPMLPDEARARSILTQLANDPGILACMAKHQWNVGSLAELYPEGKVGKSAACVMGLNRNKGQQILLRVRTDDLKGFRKILSIKQVLYHELAHNVHSEHNQEFFQLMRQIERECNELDWTQGAGLSDELAETSTTLYTGGAYRLGGERASTVNHTSVRELAARAAMMRLTAEEEEIELHCGCGMEVTTMETTEARTTQEDVNTEKDAECNSYGAVSDQ